MIASLVRLDDTARPGGRGRGRAVSSESGEKYAGWTVRRRHFFAGALLCCFALSIGSTWVWMSQARNGRRPGSRGGGGGGRVGLSTGNYSLLAGGLCDTCGERIAHYCGFDVRGPMPPEELLAPGMLSDRPELSLAAQCFLWYAKAFWTRATGGAQGVTHYRHGGMDDRAELVRKVEEYERAAGCKPFRVLPPTLDLGDAETCRIFHTDNGHWDPVSDMGSSSGTASKRDQHRLWFVKDAGGSTGNHIRLVRGTEVCGTRARLDCPLNGTVASFGIQEPLLLDGVPLSDEASRLGPASGPSEGEDGASQHPTLSEEARLRQELFKFDNRVYVLVASIHPLVILFHPGHLRLSAIPYSDSDSAAQAFDSDGMAEAMSRQDASSLENACEFRAAGAWNRSGRSHTELAMHITNPQFGLKHTRDAARILQPVSRVRGVLQRRHGERDGMKRWLTIEERIKQAVLHLVFAVKPMWADKGVASKWGHALLAIDVMLDEHLRAWVLDVNSMPSFYHRSMSEASESDAAHAESRPRSLLQQRLEDRNPRATASAGLEDSRWNVFRDVRNGLAAAVGYRAGAAAFRPSAAEWPAWFIAERSRVIRGAVDAVQEVVWRKMQDAIAHSKQKATAHGDRADAGGGRGRATESSRDDGESESASGGQAQAQPAWDRVSQGVRGLGRGGWVTIYSEVESGGGQAGPTAGWVHHPGQCLP